MKVRIIKYYLVLIFMGIMAFCSAQSRFTIQHRQTSAYALDTASPLHTLRFHNITMADGLSYSKIYSIGQDKYGFIWIGTTNGLNIYDGNRFRHIYSIPSDEKSLPGNVITEMKFAGDSVWICTNNGLCKMDIRSKKSKRIELGINNSISTIHSRKSTGYLWVGTQTGLVKYDDATGGFVNYNTSNSNISNDIIRTLYEDNDGNLWVGTFDKLNKLAKNSTVFESFDLKQKYKPLIKNNLILSVIPFSEENDSLLWVGTQTGLVLYNRYTNEMRFFRAENSNLTNSVIKTLYKTNPGTLWIGTDLGLAVMDQEFNIQIYLQDPFIENSLVNNIVWKIFEDSSGTIWLGTNNGLSIVPNNTIPFRFYSMVMPGQQNISMYEIRDIIEDENEDLWLATESGVVHYHADKGIFKTFNSNYPEEGMSTVVEAISLHLDRKDRLWAATNGGVIIWDSRIEKLKMLTADFDMAYGLRSNYITKIFELSDGTILVNTHKGIHRVIEHDEKISFEFIGNVGTISEYTQDYLWYGVNSQLSRINPVNFIQETEVVFHVPERDIFINSFIFSSDTIVWVGTNNGLIKYNLLTKKYRFYELHSGNKYPLISLLEDRYGNVWAASYSAIIKFSPESEDFDIYPSYKDIPINRFMENSCLKCRNGDLIFGGYDGLVRFNPSEIQKSEFIAPVMITGLKISNQYITPESKLSGKEILKVDISYTEDLTLDYKNRSFSLEFSSLHFGGRTGTQYKYRMDGLNHEWNYLDGGAGEVYFANLHPGKYIFRLKGTNDDGIWNNKETILAIRIKPPLWASPFMIAVYVVLSLLFSGSIFYYYSNKVRLLNKIKIMQIEKQHAENISMAHQKFFTNISHEFKTPLSLIVGPIEKLMENMTMDKTSKIFLELIEKNARRLLWLNNQLLDFRQLENKSLKMSVTSFDIIEFTRNTFTLFTDKAERKKIRYSFDTDLERLEVVMDLRKIETILFNLLTNAFKFTSNNGEVTVSIGYYSEKEKNSSDNRIFILVKDTGMGIAEAERKKIFTPFYQTEASARMERGSGIGLSLVNEYVKMHKGEIILESEVGKGAEFKVVIPLNVDYSVSDFAIDETEAIGSILQSGDKNKAGHETKTVNENESESKVPVDLPGKPYILLLEDEKEISDFIQMCLKDKYNIKVASNGKIALRMVAERLPDLVISDIIMPEMDGNEFIKKFKNNPKTSHIPLIILTGQTETNKQLEGFKLGADAFISKPLEIKLLEAHIENFLHRNQHLSEYFKLNNLLNPSHVQIKSDNERMLKQLIKCIENHISDTDLNVSIVCKETGFSHAILYRRIKSMTGQTVNEFIRTIRLRRAEQLLRTKKFNVSEVMHHTGFSNPSYFSKCFQKLYGMSPSEYIKQIQ